MVHSNFQHPLQNNMPPNCSTDGQWGKENEGIRNRPHIHVIEKYCRKSFNQSGNNQYFGDLARSEKRRRRLPIFAHQVNQQVVEDKTPVPFVQNIENTPIEQNAYDG